MSADISVVVFATDDNAKAVESLLAEVEYQTSDHTYELFVIDGATTVFNFDALRAYAESKGRQLEVVRPESTDTAAAGYNAAATQANGRVLAFIDPSMTLPLYFFRVASLVAEQDGAWMPLPYADVEMPDGSCMLGMLSPAHNTLVMPTARYDSVRCPFAPTSWPRTDVYMFLTRLATYLDGRARLFPLSGEYTSQVIKECVEECVAALGTEINYDRFNAGLVDNIRKKVFSGVLPYVPEFEVTASESGVTSINSTGEVLIPSEGWLQETDRWQDLMA